MSNLVLTTFFSIYFSLTSKKANSFLQSTNEPTPATNVTAIRIAVPSIQAKKIVVYFILNPKQISLQKSPKLTQLSSLRVRNEHVDDDREAAGNHKYPEHELLQCLPDLGPETLCLWLLHLIAAEVFATFG